jgi:hypothetical protein
MISRVESAAATRRAPLDAAAGPLDPGGPDVVTPRACGALAPAEKLRAAQRSRTEFLAIVAALVGGADARRFGALVTLIPAS